MAKAIYMSVLAATLAIPVFIASRAKDAKSGARQVRKAFLVFVVLYVGALIYVLPRLSK
jgi:hypothetical protein